MAGIKQKSFAVKFAKVLGGFGLIITALTIIYAGVNQSTVITPTVEETKKVLSPVLLPPAKPSLTVSAVSVEQSDTFTVEVQNVPTNIPVTAFWNDRAYDLFKVTSVSREEGVGDRWISIFGADAKKSPGLHSLTVTIGTTTITKTVVVAKRAFFVTTLVVTPELEKAGYAPPTIKSNVISENARLNNALTYIPTPYFSKSFVNPLDHIRDVGAYGNIRKNGSVELQHLGIDLDAVEGTPVYAINDGMVRLVEDFVNYGKTIVIDHGVGIFSFYLHLNKFNVEVGDLVVRGATIAYSGNTGYSIAPHLHFSIRIQNASVDPLRFIKVVNAALGVSN